jgi:hypothetical protein
MSDLESPTKPFTIGSYEIKGFNGRLSIPISVYGYWSSDMIHINIRTEYQNNDVLDISVGYATGGRQENELEDDIQAVRNFGDALIAASILAEKLRGQSAKFISEHKKYKKNREDQKVKALEASRKRVAADTHIGYVSAENIVLTMRAKAKEETYREVKRSFRKRGTDYILDFEARFQGEIVQFFECGTIISIKKVHAAISDCAEMMPCSE